MIIGMSSTKNWYKYLLVNIFAILSNNDVEKIYLFIEDDYIKDLDLFKKNFKTEFICINVNKNVFDKYIKEGCLNTNENTRFSKCSLSRLFFPKEINESKILYLDVDALVVSDISDLWNINLDNYYVAGTVDTNTMIRGGLYLKYIDSNDPYINSGVLLMNLKLIREKKIDDLWLYKLNHERFLYSDQDIINSVCKNHIYIFNEKFNSSICTKLLEKKEDIKIMHYITRKVNWVKNHKYSEFWYDYEKLYQDYKKANQ